MADIRENYARLVLTRGVNLQKGQILVIDAPIWTSAFVHLLSEQAYRLGAQDVVIHYADPDAERIRLRYASDEVLCDLPRWQIERQTIYGEKGACFLRLDSQDPDGMAGVDPAKLSLWKKATSAPLAALRLKKMSNDLAWSGVPVPNPRWAKKVFPALGEDAALEALWQAVYRCCYVGEESAETGWDAHVDEMQRNVRKMNALGIRALHFQNQKGTDLTLELCDGAVFAGGICHCPEPDGIVFAPNIPTEEILSTPHRDKVNGVVYNTLPLVYGGSIIDDFCLTFRDGVVVDWHCGKGADLLAGILGTDEGTRRLGEVALVPYDSPINQLGVLFYDTLFDENASCHLALGAGYVDVVPGGDRSTEALVKRGLNTSMLHVDFMFGSRDMHCTARTADGREAEIFRDGLFVI